MNHLSTEFSAIPPLVYPFEEGWHPDIGEPFEVAEGVFWLRMPLPFALDHINLWLLRDDDGWTIVDSGFDLQVCKDVWDKIFTEFLSPASVKQVIITHFHPDHIGLAAWLARRCDCPVLITRGELEYYRYNLDGDKAQQCQELREFSIELGLSADHQDAYIYFFEAADKPDEARLHPSTCRFISDGDLLTIGDSDWQVVVGNGHSSEHACLYNADKNVLISGDQVISRISSNVGVYLLNRDEDPLGNWLDSCLKIKTMIPRNTLVLPAHQEPFKRIDLRMQQLIDDHHAQLNGLRLKAEQGFNAQGARQILFDRELSDMELVLATSEALAHINYLLHRGELSKSLQDNGAIVYTA